MDNLCLMCGPCNRRKADLLRLEELRKQNRAHGNIINEDKFTFRPKDL